MKNLVVSVVGFAMLQPAMGQDSTEIKSALSISGYVEAYYNYDFNRPQNNITPGFLYNFNRAGEVNLNLGLIKASYATERVRANLGLATGTYMNANYAAEPGVLKNVYEANLGIKISKNSNLWLDAQITYKPSGKVTLNYSTFIGNDKPDSVRLMRYFHNMYGIFQLTEKLFLTTGLDYGMEQKFKGSSGYNTWIVPIAVVRYSPTTRVNIAARAEYYQDKNGVIIATGTANGFQTWGFSANVDYTVMPNVLWRVEARNFSSKDAIFTNRVDGPTSSNAFATTSLSVAF